MNMKNQVYITKILIFLGMLFLGSCATFGGKSSNKSSEIAGYKEIKNSCDLMLQARMNVVKGLGNEVTRSYITYQSYLAVLMGQRDAVKRQIIASQFDYEAQVKLLNCGPMLKEPSYCGDIYAIYSESYQKEIQNISQYKYDAYFKGFMRGLNECQNRMTTQG